MNPRRLLPTVTILSLALIVGHANVQGQYAPYYRPGGNTGTYNPPGPISPYLNMLRGTNPAVNYYLGVRPEFQLRSLQQQVLLGEERRVQVPEESTELFPKLAGTGHPALFLNYGGYYNLGMPGAQQQQQPALKRTGR
jgi:hypothetical protein